MLDYFKYLYKYFEVGAPVYFVTKRGYDFTTVEGMDGICSSVGCDQFSLTQKIQYATNYADKWVGGERQFSLHSNNLHWRILEPWVILEPRIDLRHTSQSDELMINCVA